MHTTFIVIDDVCNLSRIPLALRKNPCYLTALQVIKNPNINYKLTALYDYYKSFHLKTLGCLYDLKDTTLNNVSYDSIFLPWIHTKPVPAYKDTAFMPATDDGDIEIHVEKIKNLITSFQKYGYKPAQFKDRKQGYVTGYYLNNNNNNSFYVVSGNHRVAAYFALFPQQKLQVHFEISNFLKQRDKINNGVLVNGVLPTKYRAANVNSWPSVRNNFLTPATALSILSKYTEN